MVIPMSKFLVIRCESDDDVQALIEILKAELRQGDWNFRIGTAEDIYYTASAIAEDCSRVSVIDTSPQEIDDGE